MLVLTRKQRQQITIGENITITVLRVKGNAVRIGIEAPDGIRILRAELNELNSSTFADGSHPEESTAVSGAQRTENNSRRSRVGKEASTNSDQPVANPVREQKLSSKAAPRAGMRMAPVSLLSFR